MLAESLRSLVGLNTSAVRIGKRLSRFEKASRQGVVQIIGCSIESNMTARTIIIARPWHQNLSEHKSWQRDCSNMANKPHSLQFQTLAQQCQNTTKARRLQPWLQLSSSGSCWTLTSPISAPISDSELLPLGSCAMTVR